MIFEEAVVERPQDRGSVMPPVLREATFGDFDQIAAVQTRNGLQIRPAVDWLALWSNNPAYAERLGHWPIGWVLEAKDGQIVGSISNLPASYHLQGARLVTAASCAWAVDPAYRGFAMRLLARFMKQPNVDLSISTTVNANSEIAFRSFGWSRVPVGHWNQSEFWITDYRAFLEVALRTRGVPFSRLLSYPVAAIPSLFARPRLHPRNRRDDLEIRIVTEFDSSFDEFWHQLQSEKPSVLMADRSSAALQWHYRFRLQNQEVWIVAAFKAGRLVAYSTFDRYDNPRLSLRRIRLIDYQALKGYENCAGLLLAGILEQCAGQAIHILENTGCWLDTAKAGLEHPYRRNSSSWLYYYRPVRPELRERLMDPSVWAPSPFDGDASV